MAQILLIDPDESLASELTDVLGPSQHKVTLCHKVPSTIAELCTRWVGYDVIVLNMSRNRRQDWKALDQIHEFAQLKVSAPKILCLSTAYWGPQMQLAIERKGGRIVYL